MVSLNDLSLLSFIRASSLFPFAASRLQWATGSLSDQEAVSNWIAFGSQTKSWWGLLIHVPSLAP